MRTRLSLYLALFLICSLLALPLMAQEATPEATADMSETTGDMVVCDSELILSLYVAERFFGFATLRQPQQGTTGPGATLVDLALYDKGQFSWLFDALTGTESVTMPALTPEQLTAMSTMMMGDVLVMPSGVQNSSSTFLQFPATSGEAAECTALRSELNRFFIALAFSDAGGGMEMPTPVEVTEEAGALTTELATFTAPFIGTAEIPGPGDDDGAGTAVIVLDPVNAQLCYTLTVQNLDFPATGVTLNRGLSGTDGEVMVTFENLPDESGNTTGCTTVTPELLSEIGSNPQAFYVTVLTNAFPNGAVRAQLGG